MSTFLQVALLQNFTQAGRILGYSQSSISAQIQQLEEDVGVQLFDRIGRGVVLTQYGQELLPYAEKIVSFAAYMESFMRQENEIKGTLRLGMVESLAGMCLEPILLQYNQRFPNVKINLLVDATSTLVELLKKNQIDVACMIDDPPPKAKWQCCYEKQVKIVIVASKSHRLASKQSIGLEELCREKFILMEDEAPYSRCFYNFLDTQGIEIKPFLTLQSPRMAMRFILCNNCVSLLPYYTVKEKFESGKLVFLDVPECEQYQTVQIILHKNKFITSHINGFLDEAKSVFDSMLT
ncbi:MAG: LysR family transcriptional regulator [Lachnospiraceae bacterium]|nr:LysR family transcriptional regulator [Lachnospiraceae bacterium]